MTRVDSRSSFSPQLLRAGAPQPQQRPQFQPGGPVTSPPQFGPRTGNPAQRGPTPSGPPGSPQIRNQPPSIRPQQPSAAQQGPRPAQSPTQVQQRGPVPNSLQFGPRQPPQFGGVTTPEGFRPQSVLQTNGASKPNPNLNSPNNQISRQPSQGSLKGLDSSNTYQNKPVNLENQNASNENLYKPDIGNEMPGANKGRSYSISSAPGAPSPLKMDDDRRKSVSAVGGRYDELASRGPGLGLIQETRSSKDNIRGSRESVKSEASVEGNKDIPERPESRLMGGKMTESFMGSLTNLTPKKKIDDDDDVVSQNYLSSIKNEIPKNKTDLSDRSPSLTRSDESPEPKNTSQSSVLSKTQSPEPQRPKTPKMEIRHEMKSEPRNDINQIVTPRKTPSKSPITESKSPTECKSPVPNNKKPNDLKTSATPYDSKKSTPRKIVSAPSSRPKGNFERYFVK